ncbi:MAG TPA: hypothetical protein VGP02_19850 [Mycobacteriales bacterium]|nr:hypothetical protein [Mycobacteriales bacterium]
MFLQVHHATVDDRDGAHECLDRWATALRSDPGWLGTTAGVTDDGQSFTLTRYASADAVHGAETRGARDSWHAEMSHLSAHPIRCQDCGQVITQLRGDSPEARFVQLVQGRMADLDRLEHALEVAGPWEADARSDIIGGLLGLHGDGGFTQIVYFTSEDDAREGEHLEAPEETGEVSALVSDLTFFDLHAPWSYAPR